jgi:hypothetical protein
MFGFMSLWILEVGSFVSYSRNSTFLFYYYFLVFRKVQREYDKRKLDEHKRIDFLSRFSYKRSWLESGKPGNLIWNCYVVVL